MGNELEQKIDEIIENGHNVLEKLEHIYELRNDNYVLFRIAKFEIEKGIEGYSAHFKELLNDPSYFIPASYYLSRGYFRKKNYVYSLKYIRNVLSTDSEYLVDAVDLCLDILLKDSNKETCSEFLEIIKNQKNLNCDTYYKISKVYYKYDYVKKAVEYVKKAISLNNNNTLYHDFLIKIYSDKGMTEELYNEVRTFLKIEKDPELKRKLSLMVPKLEVELNYKLEALRSIKSNIDQGIVSKCQDDIYFNLLTRSGDYREAEVLSQKMNLSSPSQMENLLKIIKMYNRENMCNTSLDMLDNYEEFNKSNRELSYGKIVTLMQLKRYKEAKEIIINVLNEKVSSIYCLLLAVCCYYEGDTESAKKIMLKIEPSSDSKMDMFLRHNLGLDKCKYNGREPLYSKLLNKYDYEIVCREIKFMLGTKTHMSRVARDVFIRDLVYEFDDIIRGMNPSYKMGKDTYLINYGKPVGIVNDKSTSYFVVDAIPGGGIFMAKPVIPTKDAQANFSRVRY